MTAPAPPLSDEESRRVGGELLPYPQPPFLIHEPNQAPAEDIYRSVRLIQSACDRAAYPEWSADDLESAAQHLLDGLTDAEGAAQ